MLQFISHYNSRYGYVSGIGAVLNGGCRWVQLRMKSASDSEVVAAGLAAGDMCRRHGAVFIVDDRVHLVEQLGADGVHLGKGDMPVAEARRILGQHVCRHMQCRRGRCRLYRPWAFQVYYNKGEAKPGAW